MANAQLFQAKSTNVPQTDAVNSEGSPAYLRGPEQALALYACTGCFGNTFYSSAAEQLTTVKELALKADPLFLAKVAVVARERGFMKDLPAFLMAILSSRDAVLWRKAFPRVIDNAKMVRNYVQIARSGAVGKTINLSAHRQRQAIQAWFDRMSVESILRGSVGSDGISLLNALRFTRVAGKTPEKKALLAWLHNQAFKWTHETGELPDVLVKLQAFRADRTGSAEVPDVDFRMIDGGADALSSAQWAAIFRQGGWQFTRMNLNTANRQGVFAIPGMVELIAERLRDREQIRRAKVFPYQLFQAFLATKDVPKPIQDALQDALDISLENVPDLGRTVVMVDVSGSMSSQVTGTHGNKKASVVRCVDVAALIGSAILRRMQDARVIPFENGVVPLRLNSRDSVMTNAEKLSKVGGGGTNCSAPIVLLNSEGYQADSLVFVSDNESWVDSGSSWRGGGTAMHEQWLIFKKRNPSAKLYCIDLVPNTTTQVSSRPDILQVGGFSDQVFNVMASFRESGNSDRYWLDAIDKTEL